MPEMPPFLREALARPVDCSAEFTAAIAALGREIGARLGVALAHDDDMNYRAGQSLTFALASRAPWRPMARGPIEVRMYISSRAKLFAFYCFDRQANYVAPGGKNHPPDWERFPAPVVALIDTCRGVLAGRGYEEVARAWFGAPAPGCLTDMDGLPATVFEALFAELV